MKLHKTPFSRSALIAIASITLGTSYSFSQAITATLLDEETDIINTGGALVSAVHFQDPAAGDPDPLIINGIPHTVGSGSEADLTANFGFEGDFRNGASGFPQDGTNIVQVLLSGIAGANGINMEIAGLEVGKTYLFQAYWEVDRNHTLTVTFENDSLAGIEEQQDVGSGILGGTLISHTFTAGDTTYNAFLDRDDDEGGDPNNWLSGYSLQDLEVVSTEIEITSISEVGTDL